MFNRLRGLLKKPAEVEEISEPVAEQPVPVVEQAPEPEPAPNPNLVDFHLYSGRIIPKRTFTYDDLTLFMGNADVIWEACVAHNPPLALHMEMLVADPQVFTQIDLYLPHVADDLEIHNDKEACVRRLVKFSLSMLCITTTIDVVDHFIQRNRFGTLDGALLPTLSILRSSQIPIQHDIQINYVSHLIWMCAMSEAPTRPIHAVVNLMDTFLMQYDADYKTVLHNATVLVNATTITRH